MLLAAALLGPPSHVLADGPQCNSGTCGPAPTATTAVAPSVVANAAGVTPITDPATISPQTVRDFSGDAPSSRPTSFAGGTLSGNGSVVVVGSTWATWNPQLNGKHLLEPDGDQYGASFNIPVGAAGVVAEPNVYDLFNITITAYDGQGQLLGSYTRSINGLAGAAFLGLRSPSANIASIQLTSDPQAGGFAFSDLTYSGGAQKPVMFVHGINASSKGSDWTPFVGSISAALGTAVSSFDYYQDKGDGPPDTTTCVSRPVQLPELPDGGMPVDTTSINPGICDSASDLGLNAVQLDADVRAQYQATGRPIVLLANSMGAAIVRGFLAYSAERGDGVASTMVDSVFFLEGAQAGAWVASAGPELETSPSPIAWILRQVVQVVPFPVNRPTTTELAPKSPWYQWVNPPASHLPAVPYFNVFGDISISMHSCVNLGPLGGCVSSTPLALGDMVLLPGADDPHAVPDLGGARFLNGPVGSQNYEWPLSQGVVWDPLHDMTGLWGTLSVSPAFHAYLGTSLGGLNNAPTALVPDCKDHSALVTLGSEITKIVVGRANDTPYICQP